jgi:hypothetical protein
LTGDVIRARSFASVNELVRDIETYLAKRNANPALQVEGRGRRNPLQNQARPRRPRQSRGSMSYMTAIENQDTSLTRHKMTRHVTRDSSLAEAISVRTNLPFGYAPWNSDVDDSRKEKIWADSKGILLITPESIEGRLLYNPCGLIDVLSTLRFIVIDELAAFTMCKLLQN